MTLLVIGVALWWVAHLFKRLAPGPRAALSDRMGDASKGVLAVALVVSIVLMVIGYRSAEFIPVWSPPGWTLHLNNLLMLVAIALLGLGNSKSRLNGIMRHPMTTGFGVWAFAHLLVNGDLASVILFGGLLAWAVVTPRVINRAVPDWTPPPKGNSAGDVKLIVITLVLYAVIAGIHTWLGYWPFPG
jgi:uncharacterized membrane protein